LLDCVSPVPCSLARPATCPPTFRASLITDVKALPTRSGAGPCPARPALSPYPFFVATTTRSAVAATFPIGSTFAAAFSARSAVPLTGSPSSWLDPSLSWPSRPDPPFPFYSATGAATLTCTDARALPSASLARLLDDRTNEEARRSSACWCSLLCRLADRRHWNVGPSKHKLLLHVSRSRPTRLQLPRHLGVRILGVHIGLYSSRNIRTLMTLRLW
jgi:hypothetical protein